MLVSGRCILSADGWGLPGFTAEVLLFDRLLLTPFCSKMQNTIFCKFGYFLFRTELVILLICIRVIYIRNP